MQDLRQQLSACMTGRVCLLGLGNADYGDDGFGVRLAEMTAKMPRARASGGGSTGLPLRREIQTIVAGTAPERFLGRLAHEDWDHVIFLDAVRFGGAPGSVVFLNADEMAARFPQVSTHKIALGLLAKWLEGGHRTKAWLLGVEPACLKPGTGLTRAVQTTLENLAELLGWILTQGPQPSAIGMPPLGIGDPQSAIQC